jgi:hypothetical protein
VLLSLILLLFAAAKTMHKGQNKSRWVQWVWWPSSGRNDMCRFATHFFYVTLSYLPFHSYLEIELFSTISGMGWNVVMLFDLSSQSGGVSFKDRKPIEAGGCCDAWMAERRLMDRKVVEAPSLSLSLFLSLFFSLFFSLVFSLFCFFSLSLSISLYLSIYLSIYLPI